MENCTKEIGWWIFKRKIVVHSWRVISIGKFMSSKDTFHVHYKCESCGATKTKRFVEKDTLILMGIPVQEIEKITDWDYYYPTKTPKQ